MRCTLRQENYNHYILYSYLTGRFYLIPYNKHTCDLFNGKGVYDELAAIELTEIEFKTVVNFAETSFDPRQIQTPLVTGLMVSNVCNLNCAYCIANNGGAYSSVNLLNQNIDYLINELEKAKILGVLISGGEPTLNPKLPEILYKMSQKGFYITLDTNGINISDTILEIISKNKNIVPRISLDSSFPEIHDKYRGNFNDTISNILKMLDLGIDLRINTVMHCKNVMLLDNMAQMLVAFGIKKWHIFKVQGAFAPSDLVISNELAQETISKIKDKYSDKIIINCKFTKENDGFASFVIDPGLNCFSTNNDEKEKVIFGNLLNNNIIDIRRHTEINYRSRHIKKYLRIDAKTI